MASHPALLGLGFTGADGGGQGPPTRPPAAQPRHQGGSAVLLRSPRAQRRVTPDPGLRGLFTPRDCAPHPAPRRPWTPVEQPGRTRRCPGWVCGFRDTLWGHGQDPELPSGSSVLRWPRLWSGQLSQWNEVQDPVHTPRARSRCHLPGTKPGSGSGSRTGSPDDRDSDLGPVCSHPEAGPQLWACPGHTWTLPWLA